MDLNLLEYLLRVAELGSINRAAIDLQMSQPALSRNIAALEHEMGAALFVRTQGGVHLTEAGKLLADRARPLLRQFTILQEQVGEKAAGQLSIGLPASWRHVFTSRFVENMMDQYPGVALRVYEGVSNAIREYMAAGLLDLCVVAYDETPASGYRQTAMVREPLVLVGSLAIDLRSDRAISIDVLHDLKLILPAKPNVLRSHVESSMLRRGLKFHLVTETDTLALCLDLAECGLGLTVVPACSIFDVEKNPNIHWAPILDSHFTWALCENSAREHSQAVMEGRRLVLSTVADRMTDQRWFGAQPLDELVSSVREASEQSRAGFASA